MASRASLPPGSAGISSRKCSSSTSRRNATTSGNGRITSATSSSASPISEVTFPATDCVSVSATFFSPSHSCMCSFSHRPASAAEVITSRPRGSKRTRLSSGRSARMNSISSGPDFASIVRFSAAVDACPRSISSPTIAGSASSGSCSARANTPVSSSSGRAATKSPRSTIVRSASPISGSDPPMARSSPARVVGAPSISVTSTKSLPPATDIGRGVVSCHSESPSGLMGSVIICWCPTET